MKKQKNNKHLIVDNPTSDIVLKHPFKDILPDVDEFFEDENEVGAINTINAFCYKVKKLAKKYETTIDEDKFKGDALELLAEYLIKTNHSDNRIGIYNYEPSFLDGNDDVGVDGYGIGENQNPATVQVKYRAGNYVLTANEDHLSNFVTSSVFDYEVHKEDNKNMLIITTGQKVDEFTLDKMLKGKVRVLHREALREMLDNRPEWWVRFYEAVKASRIKKSDIVNRISLREHQSEAALAALNAPNQKGKIILPTGTGKTIIEAEIILQVIKQVQNEGGFAVIKVNSSRILLCFQLFEEVFKYLSSYGEHARYVNFNSGTSDERFYISELRKLGGAYREIVSTTSVDELSDTWRKSGIERLPLIVFSTYHSSEKFASSGIVPDLTIHDEAHNLVSNEFNKAAKLPSKRDFFFTATEKITDADDGLGMNNPEIFDTVIYSKSPKQLIDQGEMIPPFVHVVKAKDGAKVDLNKLDRDYDALFTSIKDAFFAHQAKIRELSFDASELGAKVLVVCRGQQDLMEMFNVDIFKKFREEYPDIHIFALSSDFGLYNDGIYFNPPVTYMKKFEFLRKVKSLPSSDKAIIFHVDMIGEGIDIPGITGVMPFRNCELSKFVQNIGRSSRLHKTDRRKLYSGEISVNDRTKWVKPYSWVIIPTFLLNSEDFYVRFKEIVKTLREDYGYIPQQHTVIDNVHGLSEDEEIDRVNEKKKHRPHTKSGLKEFEHEFDEISLIEQFLFENDVDIRSEEIAKEFEALIDTVSGKKSKTVNIETKNVKKKVNKTIIKENNAVDTVKETSMQKLAKIESSPLFILNERKANAVGKIEKGKFIVLSRSTGCKNVSNSIPKSASMAREQLLKDKYVDMNWVVLKDIPFSSSSLAASVLCGASRNGYTSWMSGKVSFGDFISSI